MRTPTVDEAKTLFNVLTDIRMESRMARHGVTMDALKSDSPPLDDLGCLVFEADLIEDVRTHLATVCRMAYRDVLMRCRVGWWKPRDDYPLHDMLERWNWVTSHPNDQYAGYHLPYFIVRNIRWTIERSLLPRQVWLTEGEVRERLDAGLGPRAAIDAAFRARHAVGTVSYETATVLDQIDEGKP